MALHPDEINAIHDYGIKLRRRAWEIVAEAKQHRDTADHSHEQVEAAHGKGAPAQESCAQLPSSVSLFEHGSSEMSGEMAIQEPLKQDEGLVVDEQGATSQAQELMFMEETEQQEEVEEHEALPTPKQQQQQQQQQKQQQREQQQVDPVPAYRNMPLGELETCMESFRSHKAWKARKDFLALKTGEQFRVPFHEQYRTLRRL